MESGVPEAAGGLIVEDANLAEKALGKCDFVFSALEMDKKLIAGLEEKYASIGLPVVSNASAHRHTPDVPMIIPEINSRHLEILPLQQKSRGWKKGFIVVKPNCSLQSYITPMHALREAGFAIEKAIIATMQAVSGAGFPGVSSFDIIDNVVPFIGGEEEKSELEPQKIFGKVEGGKIVYDKSMAISAHCNRVPVIDGHIACVSLKFKGKKPSREEIINIWRNFSAEPQKLKLPFAPEKPIIFREEENRPQPRLDRNSDKAMAVTVGRLRECNALDYRFVGLSHNTVRGAAGGGILNAELLKAKGFLK